jgi:hypothetical protein
MRAQHQQIWDKPTESERLLICAQFDETARDIIIDNAPKELSENQLERCVYETMYHEPCRPIFGQIKIYEP